MERSDLVRETLGEHIFEWFLRNKRAEWADYKAQVSQFELDRYLPDLVRRDDGTAARLARPRRRPSSSACSTWPATPWQAVADEATARGGPVDGWRDRRRPTSEPEAAFAMARALRKGDLPSRRCCCWCGGRSSPTSTSATTSSTTSACARSTPPSSRPGSSTCSWREPARPGPRAHRVRALVLNLETYQAAIDGRPLDLTYMEYELLKFLAQQPRARCSPARCCSSGCGATSTTAAPARSTSTCGGCGPSSARSTPTDPDGALGGLPVRRVPLGRLTGSPVGPGAPGSSGPVTR